MPATNFIHDEELDEGRAFSTLSVFGESTSFYEIMSLVGLIVVLLNDTLRPAKRDHFTLYIVALPTAMGIFDILLEAPLLALPLPFRSYF